MNTAAETIRKAPAPPPGRRETALPADCVESIEAADAQNYETPFMLPAGSVNLSPVRLVTPVCMGVRILKTDNNRREPGNRPPGSGLCPECGSGNTYRAGYTMNGSYRQRHVCRDCDFTFWQIEETK